MTHSANDGVDDDFQTRCDDGFVTGVGDCSVGDCAFCKEGKDISGLCFRDRIRDRVEKGKKEDRAQPHTEILNPHRSTSPILTDLIIPKRKDAREQTIIKHRIMIILQIPAVAITAAVTQVVFKGDIRSGRVIRRIGDAVCRSIAVLVIDALGLAGVDVSVVPKGERRVRGYGVVRIVFVADGGETFVVVFAGAVVEGEDLVWVVSRIFMWESRQRGKADSIG